MLKYLWLLRGFYALCLAILSFFTVNPTTLLTLRAVKPLILLIIWLNSDISAEKVASLLL